MEIIFIIIRCIVIFIPLALALVLFILGLKFLNKKVLKLEIEILKIFKISTTSMGAALIIISVVLFAVIINGTKFKEYFGSDGKKHLELNYRIK